MFAAIWVILVVGWSETNVLLEFEEPDRTGVIGDAKGRAVCLKSWGNRDRTRGIGVAGYGLQMEGNGSQVTCSFAAHGAMDTSQGYSVSMWVYPDTLSAERERVVLFHTSDGTQVGILDDKLYARHLSARECTAGTLVPKSWTKLTLHRHQHATTIYANEEATTCLIAPSDAAPLVTWFTLLEGGSTATIDTFAMQNSIPPLDFSHGTVGYPEGEAQLAAHWVFDTTATTVYDVSGNGRTLTANQDDAYTKAHALQGLSGYQSSNTSVVWDGGGLEYYQWGFQEGSPMTVTAWWYSLQPSQGESVLWQVASNATTLLKVSIVDSAEVAVTGFRTCTAKGRSLTPGWWFIAVVVTTLRTSIYVNTVLAAQCSLATSHPMLFTYPSTLTIGPLGAMRGIDEARVYSEALPAAALQGIMLENVNIYRLPEPEGSFLHMTFEKNSEYGTGVGRDSSQYGLHGTPHGTVTGASFEGKSAVAFSAEGRIVTPAYIGSKWNVLRKAQQVTLEMWVKPAISSEPMVVLSMQDSTVPQWVFMVAVGGHGQSVVTRTGGQSCYANTTISPFKWTHLSVALSLEGTAIYNGEELVGSCKHVPSLHSLVPAAEHPFVVGGALDTNCTSWSVTCRADMEYRGMVGEVLITPSARTPSFDSWATDMWQREVWRADFGVYGSAADISERRNVAGQVVGDAKAALGVLELAGAGGVKVAPADVFKKYFRKSLTFTTWIMLDGSITRQQTLFGLTGFTFTVTPTGTMDDLILDFSGAANETCTATASIIPMEWHHLAWVYSGTDRTGSFFVDGDLLHMCSFDTGGDVANSMWTSDRWVTVGGVYSDATGLLKGLAGWMKDVRVFDKVLSERQVSVIAQQDPLQATVASSYKLPLAVWYRGSLRDRSHNRAHARTTSPAPVIRPSGIELRGNGFTVPLEATRLVSKPFVAAMWVLPTVNSTEMTLVNIPGAYSVRLKRNGTVVCTVASYILMSTTVVTGTVKAHVACFVAANSIGLHVNGVLEDRRWLPVLSSLKVFRSSKLAVGMLRPDCLSNCGGFTGLIDDILVLQGAGIEDEVSGLYSMGTPVPPSMPAWSQHLTATPASMLFHNTGVGALSLDEQYCGFVGAPYGLGSHHEAFLAKRSADGAWEMLPDALREVAVDEWGLEAAPSGWDLPEAEATSSISLSNSTVALSATSVVRLFTKQSDEAWYKTQELPVLRRVQAEVSYWGVTTNGTSPGSAARVATSDPSAVLGLDFGTLQQVTSITVHSGLCKDDDCWLQSFSISVGTSGSLAGLTPYYEGGTRKRFYMSATATPPYTSTFSFSPPLLTKHLALHNFESVSPSAVVDVKAHIVTPVASAPPIVRLTPQYLYIADQSTSVKELDVGRIGFSASSVLSGDVGCSLDDSYLGSIGAWCPATADPTEWLEADLGVVTYVHNVKTVGRPGDLVQQVNSYVLLVRNHTEEGWHRIGLFDSMVWQLVTVHVRYVRWVPVTYTGYPAMQVGIQTHASGGSMTMWRVVQGGWHLGRHLTDDVRFISAKLAVAAAVTTGNELMIWLNGRCIYTETVLGTDVAVSDDGTLVVVLKRNWLLIYRVKRTAVTRVDEFQTPTCTSCTVTNKGGAQKQSVHHIYLSCGVGVIYLKRTQGALRHVETMSHAGFAVKKVDGSHGMLGGIGVGRAVIWSYGTRLGLVDDSTTGLPHEVHVITPEPVLVDVGMLVNRKEPRLMNHGSCATLHSPPLPSLTQFRWEDDQWAVETIHLDGTGVGAGTGAWNHTVRGGNKTDNDVCTLEGTITTPVALGEAIELSTGTGVAMAAWVYIKQNVTGWEHLVSCSTRVGPLFTVRFVPGADLLKYEVVNQNFMNDTQSLVTGSGISPSSWHHVAVLHRRHPVERATIVVDGQEAGTALMRLPDAGTYYCYPGWDGVSAGSWRDMRFKDVFLWDSAMSLDSARMLRDGKVSAWGAAPALMAGVGCTALWRSGFGVSVALRTCDDLFTSVPTTGSGSVLRFKRSDGAWRLTERIHPPRGTGGSFGKTVHVATAKQLTYLVVQDDAQLHLYRLTGSTELLQSIAVSPSTAVASHDGGIAVLHASSIPTLSYYKLFVSTDDAAKLVLLWNTALPSRPAAREKPLVPHSSAQVSNRHPVSLNGTAGPILVTFEAPVEAVVVARFVLYRSDDWTGGGVHLVSGSSSYCLYRPDQDDVTCKIGGLRECILPYRMVVGVPFVLAVHYVWDIAEGEGIVVLRSGGEMVSCGGQGKWEGSVRLGGGMAGEGGPVEVTTGRLSGPGVVRMMEKVMEQDVQVEEEEYFGEYLLAYQGRACDGPAVKIPVTHSELHCTQCWDACGKQYSDLTTITTVGSVRSYSSPSTVAEVHTGYNVAYRGCYVDNLGDGKAGDFSTLVGSGYSVKTCGVQCMNHRGFALQGGLCYCGDAYGSEWLQVEDTQCNTTCADETTELVVSYCGTANRSALYTHEGNCYGQYGEDPSGTTKTYVTAADGCVTTQTSAYYTHTARHIKFATMPNTVPRTHPHSIAMDRDMVAVSVQGCVMVLGRTSGKVTQAITPPVPAVAWGSRISMHKEKLAVLSRVVEGSPRSGAVFVYGLTGDGYQLEQVVKDRSLSNRSFVWTNVAHTAKGLLVTRSDGTLAAYPHDCSCSGKGTCDATFTCVCTPASELDPALGVNCKACKPGYSKSVTGTCTPTSCRSCSGHGTCTEHGLCACNPGYSGLHCQEVIPCELLQQQLDIVLGC